MHGGSDDGAGDEKNREDRRETSNGEEGVQGSHHTQLTCSTRTLHMENGRCDPRVPACLYLSCGKAERRLNPDLSVAGRCKTKRAGSRVSRPVSNATIGRHQVACTLTPETWAKLCCAQAEACTGTRL